MYSTRTRMPEALASCRLTNGGISDDEKRQLSPRLDRHGHPLVEQVLEVGWRWEGEGVTRRNGRKDSNKETIKSGV